MTLEIFGNGDVTPDSKSTNGWHSTGDDPSFNLRYGFFRQSFLVIFLKSAEVLEPRLYVNRGNGYIEQDVLSFRATQMVAIIVNVGCMGLIRSIRCDPTNKPCQFSLHASMFSDRKSALEHVQRLASAAHDNLEIWDVKRIPRFRLAIPRLGWPRGSETQRYLDATYRLAEAEIARSPNAGIWLSVIVPVYNAPRRHLTELVESFSAQDSNGAELILSDDGSTSPETLEFYRVLPKRSNIKIVRNQTNGGIARATNTGLLHAIGRWVTFLDHDDVIAPHALKLIGSALAENPRAEFLYTDEVVVGEDLKPLGLMLKPAYDPVLLSGMNYINHFSVYRREKVVSLGLLREGFDGSQDYDLLLRYLETAGADEIYHLPFPAYWWRRTRGSYSQRFIDKATDAARKALTESFSRRGRVVQVKPALTQSLHRVDLSYDRTADWPKVSIIIPSRNSFELIDCVLRGIFDQTNYPNFEVIIVDNGTTDKNVLDLYTKYDTYGDRFKRLLTSEPFNFSRSINYGLDMANGECVLLLNNDVEVRDPNWLKEMVSCLRYEGVGIVGAKLLYPDNTLQHAGVIVGYGGLAGHWYLNQPENFGGPMNRLHLRNLVTCITGAVMLISRECVNVVGGFDAENFAIAYNDVDFCIRAYNHGFRTVWTPFSTLYHHESLSRGSDASGINKRRFEGEQKNLRRLHRTDFFEDPATHPAYSKGLSVPLVTVPRISFKARTRNNWPIADAR